MFRFIAKLLLIFCMLSFAAVGFSTPDRFLTHCHSHDGTELSTHSHSRSGVGEPWDTAKGHSHENGKEPTDQCGGNAPVDNRRVNVGGSPPTPIVGGGDPAPTVEDSGTPDEQLFSRILENAAKPGVQQPTPVSVPQRQPLRVTEYMLRDWGGKGLSNLPQWIELYNPNTEAVNLKGWTFQYATRRFGNDPYKIHTLALAATEDGFSIAGGGVALLTIRTLPAWRFSGIEADQVYNLNIENVLKRGWVLTDASGTELQRIGRDAFSALRDPVSPPHQDGARVSHQVYPSEAPPESYYYGHSNDVGSPGFYEQPAPAAPSLVRRKLVGTWASLKRVPK